MNALPSLDAVKLREYIIRPTLVRYQLWSQAAENLVIGTAAQESHLGKWIKQMADGPARGIYQMEPTTFEDVRNIVFPAVKLDPSHFHPDCDILMYDIEYATLMCRLQYYRFPEKLPEHDDLAGLAQYWKTYYNTELGKGAVEEFMGNYMLYVNSFE